MAKITPYNNTETKKKQVIKMFDNIANSYDFLNHTLSLGMDNIWRKIAIKKLNNRPATILDIATGTGDFAISASKYTNANITGIDISQGMLDVGIEKITKIGLTDRIQLQLADSENLPFQDNSYDAITAGFGVRNFEDLNKGLSEMYRALKSGGEVVILEPSEPIHFPLKQFYNLYFHHILPFIGGIISKDKNAYTYLPDSVSFFPSGNSFLTELNKVGFKECKHIPLSFGIVSLYIAIK
ncbi:MAG: bifunctional demethylmenaquinone methyltransferase/2-methoxy-6-polyprenyl-1,4-benzoquinol methylase UbiE [Flavobacteriales bacterium]|jgi:demethylmenaquinone methyltransferase / 2-methoxy-6-polyprenyl-1,4-benzoquinol methylase|nr:bifunctional demethylmenaquinone methyltransferase/2-methoxy-6-polyprenyl-1,4-benzoquinol methylase UbiE [Flavobacteriales bacterium]MBT5090509.1 bifunctional demethylmenaquinone methyltransferase/2-methoxy-6-polyprenyl-1,4-benzoquinol methylase UbiE [Flavobacteriales bacterium]MBT5750459.1 bifunctional demethylmenaquinone methyltransferase/2-methoxy-6-polyprenyl-1,4-benzoquinol methylase UbiE [Flavobacteriales bacterium]